MEWWSKTLTLIKEDNKIIELLSLFKKDFENIEIIIELFVTYLQKNPTKFYSIVSTINKYFSFNNGRSLPNWEVNPKEDLSNN